MKKIFLSFLFIMLSQLGSAQDAVTAPSNDIVYRDKEVDVIPEFPGGPKGFSDFVRKNYKTPEVRVDLVGRILIEFVVYEDGTLHDIKIIRDIGYGTGEEAIRMMMTSPEWKPGFISGKAVKTRYSLPIMLDIKIR